MIFLFNLNLPKAVPFILFSILLERFASGGIGATMSLYFHTKLGFDPSTSTALFHTYEFSVFSFTIIGAIIADNWLGLYRILISMSCVYAIGAAIISVGNIELLNLNIGIFTLIGLVIAVIGVGSIKCNSNTFAANQYKFSGHASQLASYFSLQHISMKIGSMIGRFLNPILRQDVKCFGMNDCFPLSFSVVTIAMMLSVACLICGKSFYLHKPPSGNMFAKVCSCISNGILEKFKRRKTERRDHWLDYAVEKHGSMLVADAKSILNVLLMFSPIPLFWTLNMQQGSRWVFQATKMDGDLFGFYTIKPDQMIVLNSLLSILMVPIFQGIIYPLIAKIGIKTALQKIACGLFFAAVSFLIAAWIEVRINKESIHILWLFPQYLVMVMGEVMVGVQQLNFAYTESPTRMKTVMVAFVYLSYACGNIVMIFVSGTKLFESQVYEFIFFASIMTADAIVFIVLAIRYKYVQHDVILGK